MKNIKKVSHRDFIKAIVASYEYNYNILEWAIMVENKEAQKVRLDALKKLNLETATILDIAEIIGPYSWFLSEICSGCGREVTSFFTVDESGETPVTLCFECISNMCSSINNKDSI